MKHIKSIGALTTILFITTFISVTAQTTPTDTTHVVEAKDGMKLLVMPAPAEAAKVAPANASKAGRVNTSNATPATTSKSTPKPAAVQNKDAEVKKDPKKKK